jgi:hypothetical protein
MFAEDERQCVALSAKYALYCDTARERIPELFTEDALLDLPGRRLEGREAIRKSFGPRPSVATIHICTNVVVEGIDEDHARGSTHLLVFRHDADRGIENLPVAMSLPYLAGIFLDDFVRTDACWLIRSRRLSVVFRRPD